MTKFKLLLRDLRQSRDLSQDELARQLGVSRQSVISLERGEYLPSLPLLVAMIEFFRCPLEQLVEGVRIQQEENNQMARKGGEQSMQIARWDPFQAIDRMRDEMDEIVERAFGRVDWPRALGTAVGAINIHESDTDYELEVQVPGFKENEIELEVSDNTLTISGEKKSEEKEKKKNLVRREWEHTSFSRSIRFAHPIKEDKIEAKLSDGTLTITAPKFEPVKPKVKKIAVKK